MSRGRSRSGGVSRARHGLARAVTLVAGLVALVIVVGILLVVLEANPDNAVVTVVTDAAETLVGPFERLFTLDDRKLQVAVNYGIAALVYLIVGRLIARLVTL